MYKFLILFFILLLLTFTGSASKSIPVKKAIVKATPISVDSTNINVRQFDQQALKKYREEPAFNYIQQKTQVNWWDRFWDWVWHVWDNFWMWVARMIEKLFGRSFGKHGASVFKYFILSLAVFLIVYLIFRLIGINLLSIFRKKKKDNEILYHESIENIHEINFDEAIENALAIKDYRLAVRLLYLRCLKQLSDASLINWRMEKTNTAYVNEIADDEHRRQFSIVTRQFEYIWYGDFPVDGQSFQNINAVFKEFKSRLS